MNPAPDLGAYQLALTRRYIRALARLWCGGERGRGKLDPVYMAVTEGRDVKADWAHYSSCGDLSQAIAYDLGVRQNWINRRKHRGWVAGVNLTRFYDANGPAQTPALGYLPEPGDIGFIWLTGMDAHTFVFGDTLDPGHVETFNYGAGGMSATEFPGAHQSRSALTAANGMLHVGARILHKVLTVPRLLECVDPNSMPEISTDTVAGLESYKPGPL